MSQSITNREQAATPATERPQGRMSPALLQRRLRQIHLCLGMLFAPSLLFFAITGALQLYNLHELRPGRSFEPPALLQELGMVHKNQVFRMPRRRASGPPETTNAMPAVPPISTPSGADEHRPSEWGVQILKAFFLLTSMGLVASTGLGIWLGLKSGRHRGLSLVLLLAGVAIPTLLLAF